MIKFGDSVFLNSNIFSSLFLKSGMRLALILCFPPPSITVPVLLSSPPPNIHSPIPHSQSLVLSNPAKSLFTLSSDTIFLFPSALHSECIHFLRVQPTLPSFFLKLSFTSTSSLSSSILHLSTPHSHNFSHQICSQTCTLSYYHHSIIAMVSCILIQELSTLSLTFRNICLLPITPSIFLHAFTPEINVFIEIMTVENI